MGQRFINERMSAIPSNKFCALWRSAGTGRFWKRQLSKSRRRMWKQYGIEGKVSTRYEHECSCKNW